MCRTVSCCLSVIGLQDIKFTEILQLSTVCCGREREERRGEESGVGGGRGEDNGVNAGRQAAVVLGLITHTLSLWGGK